MAERLLTRIDIPTELVQPTHANRQLLQDRWKTMKIAGLSSGKRVMGSQREKGLDVSRIPGLGSVDVRIVMGRSLLGVIVVLSGCQD